MATVRFEGNSLKKVFATLECPNKCVKFATEYALDEVINLGYPPCGFCGNLENVVLLIRASEGCIFKSDNP